MSVMTKLLPIGAIGAVVAMNSDAIKENLDIISRAKVAATSGIEMRNVADAVAFQFAETKRLPLLNFGVFLKENTREKGGGETRDRSKDMWKMPYRIVMNHPESGFEIWSAGPDRLYGGPDDLRYLYVLPGQGVQGALAKHAAEWQRLVLHYRQQDANQGGAMDDSASGSPPAPVGAGGPGRRVSAAEKQRFESQLKRAESGSASAKLSLAERFMKGDAVVEKDLDQARRYLEEAVEGMDSRILKSKAEGLLRLIEAQQEK
jgi:hypothetical protein